MTIKAAKLHDDISGIKQIGDAIIRKAVRAESSGIHITPCQDYSLINFRLEGELSNPIKIPSALHKQVVSYFSRLADKDDLSDELSSNNKFHVKFGTNNFDLETDISSTEFGDSIIIHMSRNHKGSVGLASTGLTNQLKNKVCEALEAQAGVVILSGPLGSGKTTSMYAFLNHLSRQGKTVLTVERKIDMEIPNTIQLTASGAGTLITPDIQNRIDIENPDVVMLHNLSDQQTALAAFTMAQQGRMVISSVSSNDATATLAHLVNLGIDQTLISDQLKLILNQRLLRQLCPHCRESFSPSNEMLIRFDLTTDTLFHKSAGCNTCMHTGYVGRLPVHEGMFITDDLATMVRNNASEIELRHTNRQSGLLSLLEDGMGKVLEGKFNPSDVLRDLPKSTHEEMIGKKLQAKPTQNEPPATVTSPISHISSTSTIRQPLSPLAELKKAAEQVAIQTKKHVSAQTHTSNKPTILLVEDSHTMRDYIGYILRNGGKYDVVDIGTAEEALSILFQDKPSMIITDQILPGMNGTSLIATVRSNPKLSDVPIILLTSEKEMEIKALKTGADGYIEKPVDPELLLARTDAVFSTYARMQKAN